jgi:hypothetical protein
MQRFKSPRQAQDFLSAHAFIYGHFHPRRHLMPIAKFGWMPSMSGTGNMHPNHSLAAAACRPSPRATPRQVNVTVPSLPQPDHAETGPTPYLDHSHQMRGRKRCLFALGLNQTQIV